LAAGRDGGALVHRPVAADHALVHARLRQRAGALMLPLTLLAIVINIDPNIFSLGGLTLSWHGLFSASGVSAAVAPCVRAAARSGNEDGASNLALWSVAGGIVGARLFHVIDQWQYYSQNPVQIVMINEGGIAIYGAIVGGVLTGFVYALLTKLNVAAVADGG